MVRLRVKNGQRTPYFARQRLAIVVPLFRLGPGGILRNGNGKRRCASASNNAILRFPRQSWRSDDVQAGPAAYGPPDIVRDDNPVESVVGPVVARVLHFEPEGVHAVGRGRRDGMTRLLGRVMPPLYGIVGATLVEDDLEDRRVPFTNALAHRLSQNNG